jgi:hypothetical protein
MRLYNWQLVRLIGGFAELPEDAETAADIIGLLHSSRDREFIFTASYDAVLEWLEDSLGAKVRGLPGWPKQTGPFTLRTEHNGCALSCVSQDGQKTTVWIKAKLSQPLPQLPRLKRPPEGPTIPKNLPEAKKPRFDRMAMLPKDDEDDPRTLEKRIRSMDRTLVP